MSVGLLLTANAVPCGSRLSLNGSENEKSAIFSAVRQRHAKRQHIGWDVRAKRMLSEAHHEPTLLFQLAVFVNMYAQRLPSSV